MYQRRAFAWFYSRIRYETCNLMVNLYSWYISSLNQSSQHYFSYNFIVIFSSYFHFYCKWTINFKKCTFETKDWKSMRNWRSIIIFDVIIDWKVRNPINLIEKKRDKLQLYLEKNTFPKIFFQIHIFFDSRNIMLL